jgi:hypothetical protein
VDGEVAELDEARDDEHPDVAITDDNTGWTLSACQNRPAAGEPQGQRRRAPAPPGRRSPAVSRLPSNERSPSRL